MAEEPVAQLLDQARAALDRHAPPLFLCPDCGRTFTDELAHPCLGYWPGSFGNFLADERDPKRLAKGYVL